MISSNKDIAKKLNVQPYVVYNIVKAFSERLSFENFKSNRGRPRRHFDPETLNLIIGKEALQRHRFLTMKERTQRLYDDHAVYVAPESLRFIYKRHDIHYRQCRLHKRKNVPDVIADDLERAKFSQ